MVLPTDTFLHPPLPVFFFFFTDGNMQTEGRERKTKRSNRGGDKRNAAKSQCLRTVNGPFNQLLHASEENLKSPSDTRVNSENKLLGSDDPLWNNKEHLWRPRTDVCFPGDVGEKCKVTGFVKIHCHHEHRVGNHAYPSR